MILKESKNGRRKEEEEDMAELKKEEQELMEQKCFHPIADDDYHDSTGILRSFRVIPPAHYTLKIDSFSYFLNNKVENYTSGVFEAGGYKWKLSLYPNGNKKSNVNGHISLYLEIAELEKLPLGWEVNVNFKLFVYDHIRDKYLTIQDDGGVHRRFHRMKTEWGFDQFISHDTFNDASNGYLLNDCCVFGAEVFVIKYTGKGEHASMVKNPVNGTYTWKISNFSIITNEYLSSDEFAGGGHKWKLWFYPKGKNLSVYLVSSDSETHHDERKLYAEYKLRIRDQVNGNHCEKEAKNWFGTSSSNWGYADFLSLSDLNNMSKGFKVNDTVIVEAQIMFISSQF